MQTLRAPPSSASAGNPPDAIVRYLQRSTVFLSYQRAFETATGLPLVLRPLGSFRFPLEGSKRINVFHQLAARCNAWCAYCLQEEARLELEAAAKAVTVETFGVLRESAVPVMAAGHVIGHLRTGQIARQAPSPEDFENVVRRLGVPTSGGLPALERAYRQTRVVAAEQYEAAVALLSVFAGHLAAISNQLVVSHAQQEVPGIAKARAYMASHLGDEISLDDAAHAARMSAFYFCKSFHRVVGLTFTKYLARLRVESVKEALRNPNVRIGEAAYGAGFQSLSQFNRVFRRVTGESPTVFRRGLLRLTPPGRTRGQRSRPLAR